MKKIFSYLVSTAVLLFSGSVYAADSELIVFDWGGYEDEMFFQDYMEKYGEPKPLKLGKEKKDEKDAKKEDAAKKEEADAKK